MSKPRFWIPLVLITLVVAALAFLNQSPWWAWVLLAALFAGTAYLAAWTAQRRVLVHAAAMVLALVVISATAVFAYPPAQNRSAGVAGPTAPVTTREGPVTGVPLAGKTVDLFAGIPYAQPPVGDLRWREPQPPSPRKQVFAADRFSDVPIQTSSSFTTRALTRVLDAPLEKTLVNPYPTSEDSLTLNVWRSTRPTSEPKPVLVYIPGGGFSTGSGALPLYDGAALAERGSMITVTLNYRLGVFGFLSHPDLSAQSSSASSGNYGLLDQIAALTWIRNNIAAFGGDPERVTLAGESAGSESVCNLAASPLTRGLVHGLIGQSGGCLGTGGDVEDGDQFDTRDAAESAGERLSELLDGASVEEMRAMPADRIRKAAADLADHWRPSVDGHVLPELPAEIYTAGEQLDVPMLAGSNAQESSLALLSPPDTDPENYPQWVHDEYGPDADAYLKLYPGGDEDQVLQSRLQAETDRVMTRAMYRWATLHTRSSKSSSYLYFFTRTPPDDQLQRFGAYHGAEVMYAYDNLGADDDATYGEKDYRLRDLMSDYWVAFVHNGDPNAPDRRQWSDVESAPEQVMEFGSESRLTDRPRPAAIDFWMEYDGPIA